MRYLALVLLGIVLALAPLGALAQTNIDYQLPTKIAAQEALNRLGFDVGTPDGAWGPKSRAAMNKLRADNGLQPADKLTGSSLMLIHKLSPGDTTIPHPGVFIEDAQTRRTWLVDHPDVANSQCPARVGISVPLEQIEARRSADVNKLDQPGDADWWSAIGESIIAAETQCLKGDDPSCNAIIDFADRWASAKSLQTKISQGDPRYENTKSAADYILRDLIIAFGLARQIVPVDPKREALIVDWMKDRVDFYYHPIEDTSPDGAVHSARADNHGIANMVPAMALGILLGDRSMMEPAVAKFREAIKFVREDGSLPTETTRGGAWFFYSALVLSQLTGINELAAAQGITLAEAGDDSRYTLPHALTYLLDAVQDFDLAEKYSKDNWLPIDEYGVRTPLMRGFNFGFLPAYAERFGDDANMQRLQTATIDEEVCSKEQIQSGRFEAVNLCNASAGKPVSLRAAIKALRPEPFHHMGYAAGCLQGTKTWSEMLGIDAEGPATSTTQFFSGSDGDSPQLDTGLRTTILDGKGPAGLDQIEFNIAGTYAKIFGNVMKLELIINTPSMGTTAPASDAGGSCRRQLEGYKWEDQYHLGIAFNMQKTNQIAPPAKKCLFAAAPPEATAAMQYLLDNFPKIARDMVEAGDTASITNTNVRAWIEAIGSGAVVFQVN